MKEKILRATAKIIAKEGIKAASTRAICEAVGVKAPTLYYHFKDKSEILESVTLMAFEKHYNHLTRVPGPDPIADLIAAWDNYFSFMMAESEFFLTMINSLSRGQVPAIAYRCYDELKQNFIAAEKKGLLSLDAISAARIYLSAAQGIALYILTTGRGAQHLDLAQKTRDITLAGLLKKSS